MPKDIVKSTEIIFSNVIGRSYKQSNPLLVLSRLSSKANSNYNENMDLNQIWRLAPLIMYDSLSFIKMCTKLNFKGAY